MTTEDAETTTFPEVETIRRAATLMRERATAATDDGRWFAGGPYIKRHELVVSKRHPFVEFTSDAEGRANAAHVAAFANPAVALAVADWLDVGANPYACVQLAPMLAVARAYLRDES